MLLYYGVYSEIGAGGAVLLTVLFVIGAVFTAFLKKTKIRIIAVSTVSALLVIFEVGMIIPFATDFNGDGFAVTAQLSLIISSFLAPFVAGMISFIIIRSLICIIKNKKSGVK